MDNYLITADGAEYEVRPDVVRHLMDSSTRFWLDLDGLDQQESDDLLRDTFAFHPLAIKDAQSFGQRPKLASYDNFVLMVLYGVSGAGELTEVHCFFTETYAVTVHHSPCPQLRALAEQLRQQQATAKRGHVMLLYRVADVLVDGYFPVLDQFDDQIDELEDEILRQPTDQQLGQLFDMKRSLIAVRKVVTPQRDMFASLLSDTSTVPGMTPDAEPYFRDLYDRLIRISDLVDGYRDLMSGALDTHLSTVSNRLNVVMKQLTIIATVFLPLSFLTGFFGQNFAWMVNRLMSFPVFLFVGIGLELLAVIVLLVYFQRRGWMSGDGTVPAAKSASRPRAPRAERWRQLLPAGMRPGQPTGA
jgi:magnesium transporter